VKPLSVPEKNEQLRLLRQRMSRIRAWQPEMLELQWARQRAMARLTKEYVTLLFQPPLPPSFQSLLPR
jgi:hypothetical protein